VSADEDRIAMHEGCQCVQYSSIEGEFHQVLIFFDDLLTCQE
jgi:hypothetical protein